MSIRSVLFTARKRSLGQGNIFRSVCQEFCSQEDAGSALVHAGIPTPPGPGTPPEQTPPLGPGTPWDQAPPSGPGTLSGPGTPGPGTPGPGTPQQQCMLGDRQQAGGMHPTGMQSCWGKFLLVGARTNSTRKRYQCQIQRNRSTAAADVQIFSSFILYFLTISGEKRKGSQHAKENFR